MNAEQLNSARLARWSQDGNARLTLESAAEWLDSVGFCTYLPATAGAPPAPSFLEAVVGRPARVPSAGERSRANDLLARMVENSSAVPLRLTASHTEEPDCIASPEAFRYFYALRGNRNFKAAPSIVGNEKVTPLALHCWQAIQEQGSLEVSALQTVLGQEVAQAAILRALHELWFGMYAFPVPAANDNPVPWDLLPRRFPRQVAAGVATSHLEAQSAAVSLYLHAAVAASEDQILAAVSPLATQSKLREVIRGLGSMRQLDIIDIGGRAHVCLQGGLLPEAVAHFAESQLVATGFETETVSAAPTQATGAASDTDDAPLPTTLASTAEENSVGARKNLPKFAPKKLAAAPRQARRGAGSVNRDFHGGGDRAGFRPGFRSGGFDGPKRRASQDRDRGGADEIPGKKRQSFLGGGAARPHGGRQSGPGQWKKSSQGPNRFPPKFQERNGGPAPGNQSTRFKPREDRPWRTSSGASVSGRLATGEQTSSELATGKPTNRPMKPWQRKNSRDFRDAKPHDHGSEKRFQPWKKRGAADRPQRAYQVSGETTRSDRGAQSADRKPWKARRDGQVSGFNRSGFQPPGKTRRGESRQDSKRFAGSKPWPKRGFSETPANRNDESEAPKRRDETGPKAKPSGRRDAKPFWARNPRGGKGPPPAARSNRPRVKDGGKKKHGKKK